MAAIEDTVGAFVPGPRRSAPPLGSGRLSGLSFAVKDLFDVAGCDHDLSAIRTGRARILPAVDHRAGGVMRLLQAGARLAGKTKTQELAYGLTGENVWQGTPLNPRRAGPVPGRLELRLGRRGGGWAGGFRAWLGHRRVGAHSGELLRPVRHPAEPRGDQPGGRLPAGAELRHLRLVRPRRVAAGRGRRGAAARRRQGVEGPLLRVEEAWVNAQPEVAEALRPALEKLEQLRGRAVGVRLAPEGIDSFFDHFRTVQAEEAWAALGGWVEAAQPRFGPGVERALRRGQGDRSRRWRRPGARSAACCRRASGRCWPAAR